MSSTTEIDLSLQQAKYTQMNALAEPHGVVFFGANYMASLPVCELAKSFHMDENLYNRSFPGMKAAEAGKALEAGILELQPEKVFVNIGDADLDDPELDTKEFLANYEWLLYTIHTKTAAKLYVISIFSDTPMARKLNEGIRKLAEECGSVYIDVTSALGSEQPELYFFEQLRRHIRCHPICFSEAMNMVLL